MRRILPDWNRGWVKELLRKATGKMYFKPGTRLFEVNGKSMPGIKWGVWALLVEGGVPKARNVRVVTLKARMFKQKTFPKSQRSSDQDRQLLVRTRVELLNGAHQKLDVLVDTGAEANLIKKGLIPDHLFYPAQSPLRFEAANGEVLAGGSRCTRVKMLMQLEKNEKVQPEKMEYEVEFYEACIKVDAILSFPWLAENKLGIFPHHKTLVMDSPDLHFLYGMRDTRRKRKKAFKRDSLINDINAAQQVSANLEKFDFQLPEEGFDQRKKFLNVDDLHALAAQLPPEDPPGTWYKPVNYSRGGGTGERHGRKGTKIEGSSSKRF